MKNKKIVLLLNTACYPQKFGEQKAQKQIHYGWLCLKVTKFTNNKVVVRSMNMPKTPI